MFILPSASFYIEIIYIIISLYINQGKDKFNNYFKFKGGFYKITIVYYLITF